MGKVFSLRNLSNKSHSREKTYLFKVSSPENRKYINQIWKEGKSTHFPLQIRALQKKTTVY